MTEIRRNDVQREGGKKKRKQLQLLGRPLQKYYLQHHLKGFFVYALIAFLLQYLQL